MVDAQELVLLLVSLVPAETLPLKEQPLKKLGASPTLIDDS